MSEENRQTVPETPAPAEPAPAEPAPKAVVQAPVSGYPITVIHPDTKAYKHIHNKVDHQAAFDEGYR